MTDILLHPDTEQQLKQLIANPPHGLLLSGAPGLGKMTIATHVASQILGTSPEKLTDYPYIRIIQPTDNKAIGIEPIRELEHFLSLKIPGTQSISRIIIIADAHMLTIEAQNALLKTLEEPPLGTLVLLTSAHDQALLPTIRSRAQMVTIIRPGTDALTAYLQQAGHSSPEISQSLAMSGGLPGLSHSLLAGEQDHPLVQATLLARDILQKSTYERMLLVDTLSKDREATGQLLFILEQMAHVALIKSTDVGLKRWQTVLTAAYTAREQLLQNGQTKLLLTNLMLNL